MIVGRALFLICMLYGAGCAGAAGDRPSDGKIVIASVGLQNFDPQEERLHRCLARTLGEQSGRFTLISPTRFREIFYPWFEHSTAPHTDDALAEVLRMPAVRRRVIAEGPDFLLAGRMVTTTNATISGAFFCGGGPPFGGGCFGTGSQERKTELSAVVWDMRKAVPALTLASKQDGNRTYIGVIIPLWITTPTEDNACREAAGHLQRALATLYRQPGDPDGK